MTEPVDRATRPRRPPHPHDRLGRDRRRREHPRPRRRARRPRRHRHHRPRAHRRCRGRAGDGPRPRGRHRGRGRRGGHHPRRPPAGAVDRSADPALPIAAQHDQGRPRRGRPGHPGPSARAVSAVRPGPGPARISSTTATRRVRPDGLETFNPTALGRPWHDRVVRFADEHGLARVGNSDAHALDAIGAGWTTFEGRTAADLRRAIEARETDHRARSTMPWGRSACSGSS